jgi:hypothetical protein
MHKSWGSSGTPIWKTLADLPQHAEHSAPSLANRTKLVIGRSQDMVSMVTLRRVCDPAPEPGGCREAIFGTIGHVEAGYKQPAELNTRPRSLDDDQSLDAFCLDRGRQRGLKNTSHLMIRESPVQLPALNGEFSDRLPACRESLMTSRILRLPLAIGFLHAFYYTTRLWRRSSDDDGPRVQLQNALDCTKENPTSATDDAVRSQVPWCKSATAKGIALRAPEPGTLLRAAQRLCWLYLPSAVSSNC